MVGSLPEKSGSQRPDKTSLFRRYRHVIGVVQLGATKSSFCWEDLLRRVRHSCFMLFGSGSSFTPQVGATWQLTSGPKKVCWLVSRREPHWGCSLSLTPDRGDQKLVRHAQKFHKISPVGLFISSVMFWGQRFLRMVEDCDH